MNISIIDNSIKNTCNENLNLIKPIFSEKGSKNDIIGDSKYKDYLSRVFKNLVKISSGSIDDNNLKKPTSKGQIKVFKYIKKELRK